MESFPVVKLQMNRIVIQIFLEIGPILFGYGLVIANGPDQVIFMAGQCYGLSWLRQVMVLGGHGYGRSLFWQVMVMKGHGFDRS